MLLRSVTFRPWFTPSLAWFEVFPKAIVAHVFFRAYSALVLGEDNHQISDELSLTSANFCCDVSLLNHKRAEFLVLVLWRL